MVPQPIGDHIDLVIQIGEGGEILSAKAVGAAGHVPASVLVDLVDRALQHIRHGRRHFKGRVKGGKEIVDMGLQSHPWGLFKGVDAIGHPVVIPHGKDAQP